jgi:hypothetical protein
VQTLARFARRVVRLATPAASRILRLAPVLPESVNQYRRHGQLLDEARAFFPIVDPFREFRVLVAECERFDRKYPIARIR